MRTGETMATTWSFEETVASDEQQGRVTAARSLARPTRIRTGTAEPGGGSGAAGGGAAGGGGSGAGWGAGTGAGGEGRGFGREAAWGAVVGACGTFGVGRVEPTQA